MADPKHSCRRRKALTPLLALARCPDYGRSRFPPARRARSPGPRNSATKTREVPLGHHDIEKLCLKLQLFEVEIGDFEPNSPARVVLASDDSEGFEEQLRPGLYFSVSANTPVVGIFVGAAQPIGPSVAGQRCRCVA